MSWKTVQAGSSGLAAHTSLMARRWGLTLELARWWYLVFALLCLGSWMVLDTLHSSERERMRSERFSLFLTDLREKVEIDLRIGFGIQQDRGAQSRVDELIRQAPELQSIDIFDLKGRAVVSTDRGTVDETVEPAWLDAVLAANGGHWRHEQADVVAFGVPVRGAFGEVEGQIVVTYPLRASSGQGGWWSASQPLVVCVLVLLLGGVLPFWLMRPYALLLAQQERRINEAASNDPPLDSDHPVVMARTEMSQVRAQLKKILAELDDGV